MSLLSGLVGIAHGKPQWLHPQSFGFATDNFFSHITSRQHSTQEGKHVGEKGQKKEPPATGD